MTIETAPNVMEKCYDKGSFNCYYVPEIGIQVDVQTCHTGVPSFKLHKTYAKGFLIVPQLNVEYQVLQGYHIRAGQNVRRLFSTMLSNLRNHPPRREGRSWSAAHFLQARAR
jgi:hypothetical protein